VRNGASISSARRAHPISLMRVGSEAVVRRFTKRVAPRDELQRKLAESHSIMEGREKFASAAHTVDHAEPAPESPEARRRAVHETGWPMAERMRRVYLDADHQRRAVHPPETRAVNAPARVRRVGAAARTLPRQGTADRAIRKVTFADRCERHAAGAVYALAAMLATLVSAGLVLEIWRSDLRVPFAYSSDALFVEAVTKNLEHGWYYTNASLAAPFGQQLYDFPIGNALNMAVLKVLALIFSNPVIALNTFFLLTFPATALAAFFVMRSLRVSLGVAAACSVLFAVLPYHFRRGEAHAFLSAYYAIPLIAYLFLGVLGSCRLFSHADGSRRRFRFVTRRNLFTVSLCAIVGASSPYYALAAALLLVCAAVIAAVAHHSMRRMFAGLGLAGAIVAIIAASAAPAIAYRVQHGTNPLAGKRSAFETELYGMKISDLVLPLDHHRLKPLARMKEEYNSTTRVGSEGGQTLGFIGTFGLIALVGGGFVTVVRGSWRIGGATFLQAGAGAVIVLLFATAAGFSSVVSYTISPQLHAWNRLSILLGFFSLLAIAFLFDALWRRWRATALRVLFPFVLLAVVVLGVLDQTSSAFVPPYKEIRASFRSDARFVAALERRLPSGASIYQLPYVAFPESVVPGANDDYAELKGYLHSSKLRWSYGAMKGRETDWAATLSTLPLRLALPAITASGFDGIYVNRSGYADDARAIERELSHRLRQRPFASGDGRLLFFDLRPLRRWLHRQYSRPQLAALRVAALHPATIRWSDDFWPLEQSAERTWRWSRRRDVYFELVNPTRSGRRVILRFVLAAGLSRTSNTTVFYPDGSSQLVRVTPTGVPVEYPLVVPPGVHPVRLSSDTSKIPTAPGDPRSALYLRVANLSLVDSAFQVLG